MSEADEAYEAARLAIRNAAENGSKELSLSGFPSRISFHLTTLPPEISTLTTLQSLDLGNTQAQDIASLRGLTALQSLDLAGTQVQDVAPLQGLAALQSLDLAGTQVQDIAPLQGLAALQSLDLAGTQVQDIAPLQGLAALQSLNLTSTQVQDIAPLQDLAALQSLNLWSTRVQDIAPLQGLTALQSLNLWSTQVQDIAPLQGLTALKSLNLWSTRVQDIAPLQGLTALQSLILGDTQIQDIAPLQGLTALKSLNFGGTRVQDIAPLQDLTALVSLNLGGTRVQDIAPLQGLTALQSLNLRSTQVADLHPIRNHENLAEAAKRALDSGLHIMGCTACLNDPDGLGRLADIKDDEERTRKILDFLSALPDDWTPPGVPAADEQKDPSEDPGQPDTVAEIEAAVEGPILRDAISDVALIESHFEAVSPDPPLPKARGEDYRELVETLARAARQLADSVPPDQFGPEPPKELRDYADRIERDQPNGRLLDYIMDTIRGFLTDEYLSGALDGVNRTRLESLLRNHNDFIRAYFPNAGQAEVAEAEVPDTELVDQLPEEVERAIGLIKSGIALDVFGESMLAPVAYLKSRMEAAIRITVTSAVPENVRAAFVTLRKTATLLTAYVGRAYGRLLEWDERQVKWAKEHPVTTTASFVTIVTGAPKIISSIAPYFAHLWRWIGNLPLPF